MVPALPPKCSRTFAVSLCRNQNGLSPVNPSILADQWSTLISSWWPAATRRPCLHRQAVDVSWRRRFKPTAITTEGKLQPCSLSLVLDRSIRIVGQFQIGCGHVQLSLRCDAAHCPLQFVFTVDLVRALESLPHHGHLR